MKKMKIIIVYIVAVTIFIGTLYAQTPKWVSTEAQNRIAVLEAFTGMYCQDCHDGHRIANEILNAYPNQFIIINNHCGPYSFPPKVGVVGSTFKTDVGDTIYEQAGVEEFPAGSINRSATPWAISRDKWQNAAEDIMNQKSIVNVYVKPEINSVTRELSVEVEYYYTDDSPVSENYLTVMLLQNNRLGYQALDAQTGTVYNQNEITEIRLYNHMHILRMVLSDGGAWGDVITNTKKGSYECRKYTTTLPSMINHINLDITNLEVVAFISESKSNIYTGHKAVVEIPKEFITDLAIEDLTEYHNTFKFEPIRPKFKVTNNSDLPVTKFVLSYILFNPMHNMLEDVIPDFTYNGILNKGESFIYEFPELTKDDLKVGSTYSIDGYFHSIYNNDVKLIELNTENSTSTSIKMALFDNAFSEIQMGFEKENKASINGDDNVPNHAIFDFTFNPNFKVLKDYYSNVYYGAKNSAAAILFYLHSSWNVADKPGYIMFGEVDCHNNPKKTLSYYYAYSDGAQNGTVPKIVIEISKDWGITWQTVSELTCEETGQPENINDIYVPKSEEYKYVRVDLSNYVQENFIIRIGGVPGTNGNALWIDEITLTNIEEESIKEDIKLALYPNPATNILNINDNNLLGAEYEIYDMSGKLIIKDINNSNIINIENLCSGTYSLKIKDGIFNFIKK